MECFNKFIIDTKKLKNNVKIIKNQAPNSKFCAVVKANAYGLGVQSICTALKDNVDYFACATLSEALSIRVFDKISKILVLGYINISDFDLVVNNDIILSVGNEEQIKWLIQNCKSQVKIHLQINTGLNRYGFRSITVFKKVLNLLKKNPNIILDGVYSHFATKEQDVQFMNKQYFRFIQFKKLVKDNNVVFHIANSYGIANSKKFHLDMIRSGFLMYGFMNNSLNIHSVLTIKSKIVHIHNIKKGDSVGYDRLFVAKTKMQIAVVPLGYADGINRRLSNNFYVLINGNKCPIIGNICMDVFMVDISNMDISIGQEVIIIGKSKDSEITINDMARVIGTSPYEVVCNFNYKRMKYIELL